MALKPKPPRSNWRRNRRKALSQNRAAVHSEEPHDHREFYGPTILITPEDAEAFLAEYIDTVPTYDWSDFWGPSNGAIRYR